MRRSVASSVTIVAFLLTAGIVLPIGSSGSIETGVRASFDGTPIVYTLFLPNGTTASSPVPVVLMTHGWAGSRPTTATGTVGRLLDAGMGVLTWDSRGFGQSGGLVELDSPDFEVRDASALIDMLAADPRVAHEAGDPIVGMTGGSYAGEIQLLTAALDPRVDAITPDIAWNDLRQSLGPGGVPKEGWIQVLFGAGVATGTANGLAPGNPAGPQAGSYDSNLPSWYAQVHAVNGVTPEVDEGLYHRSAAKWMDGIEAATLITQGIPDTLFNGNEGYANFEALRAKGVPTRIVLFCGGHAGCPYVSGQGHATDAAVNWLSAHLLGNTAAIAGAPAIEVQSSDGSWHAVDDWRSASGASVEASFSLVSTPLPAGGGGFAVSAGGVSGSAPEAPRAQGVTTTRVPVPIEGDGAAWVNGIGSVDITVSGAGTEAFLFFRLVDATTNKVIDGQTQAIRIPVSSFEDNHATIELVGVSYRLEAGHELALEISTNDLAHAANRAPGAFDISISATVPYQLI